MECIPFVSFAPIAEPSKRQRLKRQRKVDLMKGSMLFDVKDSAHDFVVTGEGAEKLVFSWSCWGFEFEDLGLSPL